MSSDARPESNAQPPTAAPDHSGGFRPSDTYLMGKQERQDTVLPHSRLSSHSSLEGFGRAHHAQVAHRGGDPSRTSSPTAPLRAQSLPETLSREQRLPPHASSTWSAPLSVRTNYAPQPHAHAYPFAQQHQQQQHHQHYQHADRSHQPQQPTYTHTISSPAVLSRRKHETTAVIPRCRSVSAPSGSEMHPSDRYDDSVDRPRSNSFWQQRASGEGGDGGGGSGSDGGGGSGGEEGGHSIAKLSTTYEPPLKRPLKQFTRKRKSKKGNSAKKTWHVPMDTAGPATTSAPDQTATASRSASPSNVPSSDEKCCRVCGIITTPQWRRGPDGEKSLCNACGLHYFKIVQRERTTPFTHSAVSTEGRLPIEALLNPMGHGQGSGVAHEDEQDYASAMDVEESSAPC